MRRGGTQDVERCRSGERDDDTNSTARRDHDDNRLLSGSRSAPTSQRRSSYQAHRDTPPTTPRRASPRRASERAHRELHRISTRPTIQRLRREPAPHQFPAMSPARPPLRHQHQRTQHGSPRRVGQSMPGLDDDGRITTSGERAHHRPHDDIDNNAVLSTSGQNRAPAILSTPGSRGSRMHGLDDDIDEHGLITTSGERARHKTTRRHRRQRRPLDKPVRTEHRNPLRDRRRHALLHERVSGESPCSSSKPRKMPSSPTPGSNSQPPAQASISQPHDIKNRSHGTQAACPTSRCS